MNFWQGHSVRLRAIEPGDAALFIGWNLDSDRARSLDFLWPPQSAAAVQAWAEEKARQRMENGCFHWVIENASGEAVGSISTHACDPSAGTFSYGVDIAAEHRRRGYAGEAILLVLKYYFDERRYQKATVPVHADNPASIALHQKLGFQLEGRHRRMLYSGGEYIDVLWYGLTVEEFHARVEPAPKGNLFIFPP